MWIPPHQGSKRLSNLDIAGSVSGVVKASPNDDSTADLSRIRSHSDSVIALLGSQRHKARLGRADMHRPKKGTSAAARQAARTSRKIQTDKLLRPLFSLFFSVAESRPPFKCVCKDRIGQ